MVKGRVDVISLGCSKNLVDSERLMAQFKQIGLSVEHDSHDVCGEFVVVNTCGFIGDAKEESINMILQLVEAKKRKRIGKLYVMGCLSERYLAELEAEIPEVDGYYGKFNWVDLIADLGHEINTQTLNSRVLTTPSHYAYVKIAEGCNRTCSYCAIPIITGKYKSRPIEEIVDEVALLAKGGVREIQLIAQDLTFYGNDIYRKSAIAQLVQRITEVEGIEWVRLHYGYPAHFPMDLLDVMRDNPKVCSYMDIALQHISDNMLSRMRRNITKAQTYELLRTMRERVPGWHIRTTLRGGHPDETEEDFAELMQFVRDMRFERLGVFAYSDEEGTYANMNYEDNVPEAVKQERVDAIMEIQQDISAEINRGKVGMTMRVIIDRKDEEFFVGRTEFDSPEVDGEVYIPLDSNCEIGGMYDVEIVDADLYDLYGKLV